MNRYIALIFSALILAVSARAQQIVKGKYVNGKYNNVSLSDALSGLARQQTDYAIMFLYNELEDFRITTTVSRKTLPDAIQQMIGFYPVSMTVDYSNPDGKKIFVECIHKTDRRLTGSIIDEQGHPVAYANVAVLNPADSLLLSGGVSNESGYFAVPIEQEKVLVRITYVGYKTLYRLCNKPEVGTVRMQPDNYTIKGVVVQGERPKVQMQGNSLVMNVEGTVMERLGTAEDVLSRVPTISKNGEGYEILGKGAPVIYVNNRKLTDLNELRNILSDNIRNIEVVQNPGARYDASVNAVIIIRTKRVQGEGIGVELTSWSRKGRGYVNNERINLTYRKGGLELFANLFGAYNKRVEKGEFEQTVFADTLWVITNRQKDRVHNPFLEGRFGFNYQLNDSNSFGGFYQNTYDYVKTHSEYDDDLTADGNMYDHLHNSGISRAEGAPKHQVNLYYMGKIGKMSINFNADYTYQNQRNCNQQQELSESQDDRDVNTYALTRSRLMAEKLFVSHPIGKGQIEVGEEYTNTRWNSSFENAEGYIANSNNEQHEQNIAPFVELRQQFGRLQLSAGLRYEHVESEYFVDGVRRDGQCRTYNDFFPSLSFSTSMKNLQLSFSYAKRTQRPSYWQLSSDVIYENRLNLQTGNPYLRPVKYHNVNAMAMWKWLYLTANYSHCVDPILYTAGSLESDSKVNLITRKNYDNADWLIVTLGTHKNIRLSESVTWMPQYNISLMKPWLKTTFLGRQKSFNQPMLTLQLGNIVTLPHDWLLQADFNVHTHGCTGANAISECTNPILSLSISKDFFKRRLNVKLSGNDLFNGGIGRFTLYSNQFMIRKVDDDDSRCVTLSLRYRFNVTPSKYKGTGAGNAEKNRM
ncbi:MAG: TonB-dependent receptor [Prevotella sp.]|nr:TonB-dependent receptor [Prevotella sp.]